VAPSNLVVTSAAKTSLRLAWSDNSAHETGFRVYRCAGSTCTPTTLVATLAANSQAFTNSGLARRTTYRYRVRAYNASGESAPSNIAARTTG
jgi:chitodextrinase